MFLKLATMSTTVPDLFWKGELVIVCLIGDTFLSFSIDMGT